MDIVNFTPLEELTAESIQLMFIHTTRSSIRKYAAVKQLIAQPAGEKVPALYYVKEVDPVTAEVSWSIHALSSDVTKFLLTSSLSK